MIPMYLLYIAFFLGIVCGFAVCCLLTSSDLREKDSELTRAKNNYWEIALELCQLRELLSQDAERRKN